MQLACRGCAIWCILDIAIDSNFCCLFGSQNQLWCLMMCFSAKAVGDRLGSCFELVDKRSSWQFCAYFLHQAKVRLKFVYISTIVSPWGFLNRKIKYLPLTGKSNCHLPSACFPFGLLNSSFLSMVVVVKAATLEHFGIF